MVRAISVPNFRMIGRIVPEKQGGGIFHPPDTFIAQNTWTGNRVNEWPAKAPLSLKKFHSVANEFSDVNDVLCRAGRIVIPASLREDTL